MNPQEYCPFCDRLKAQTDFVEQVDYEDKCCIGCNNADRQTMFLDSASTRVPVFGEARPLPEQKESILGELGQAAGERNQGELI